MDNVRRIIIFFTVTVFFTLGIIGFLLALANEDGQLEAKKTLLEPTGKAYEEGTDPEEDEEKNSIGTETFLVAMGEKDCEIVYTMSFNFSDYTISSVFYYPDIIVNFTDDTGVCRCETLAEIYNNYGLKRLSSCVSGLLSIRIDHSLYVSYDSFSSLVSYFTSRDEGVSYYIPVKIDAKNHNNRQIAFSAGENQITGSKAAELLSFYRTYDNIYDSELVKFYDGTREPQTEIAATFITEFIKQKLTGEIDEYYAEYYKYFSESFYSACGFTEGSDFISVLSENKAKFKEENIKCYITESNISYNSVGRVSEFSNIVDEITNSKGKIVRTGLTEKQTKALAAALY